MPYNGAGTYSAPSSSFNPAVATTTIDPTAWNGLLTDISTALSTALLKDGTQTATAGIPFASGVTVDTISEFTSGAGVTAAGVKHKTGNITLTDSSDTTKKLTFSMAGITTATTRTLTVPDSSGTIALTSGTLTPTLTSAHLLVGNVSNVATDVALSGDATLANTGAMTLATVNTNVGSFTNANVTVNAKGLVTAAASGSSGKVAQIVRTETGAVATGTTVLPDDDTIPQNTEGDQYMSLAITPTSATNILLIDVVAAYVDSSAGGNRMTMALFQDSTANALAASALQQGSSTASTQMFLRHTMVAGTTSATTFKMRMGLAAGGTTTFNGAGGARKFGGVAASSIVITEYSP